MAAKIIDKDVIKALKAFAEYFTVDEPFHDMKKTDYRKMGSYFKKLPSGCFVNPKTFKVDMYHARSEYLINKSEKLTDSGIISIGSFSGVNNYCGGVEGEVWAMRIDMNGIDKVASAKRIYDLAVSNEIIRSDAATSARIASEFEHLIIPTKSMKDKFKRYAQFHVERNFKLYA